MISSIPGLEFAKICSLATIEYDFVDPRATKVTSSKGFTWTLSSWPDQWHAGYEEAAAQGLIAGINAALQAGNGADYTPFVLDRADAYIGVMIDDLITRGAPEPYRMFTSRAEYRHICVQIMLING